MSTLKVNNIQNANGTSAIAIDSSGVATFSKTLVPSSSMMYRNLIINGDMRIDQRNAGASVSSNNSYAVDRLRNVFTSGGSFTAQQSTTAPDNFTNSVVWTVGSATSATSSQVANMQYRLEGNTLSHLGFGTSSAQTITLSFWVRSSVTGTYCAAFINSAADRAYVAEYTISSANTWEQKSITLTGDTSGTWLTTNGIGLRIQFDLGSGSDYNATANTWVGANDFRTTNQTDFINNAGATFYITGVQLEVGDAATPFEHRPYDAELARCQRYYYVPVNGVNQEINVGWYYNNTWLSSIIDLPVPMRVKPSMTVTSGTNYYILYRNNSSDALDSFVLEHTNNNHTCVSIYNNTDVSGTAGQAGILRAANASAKIELSSEL